MPKLLYIESFYQQLNESDLYGEIYKEQVIPRLSFNQTEKTKWLEAAFNNDSFFEDQSDFCKKARRCIIDFDKNVMQTVQKKPLFFTVEDWQRRVEEMVYLKMLCVDCSVAKNGDTKLKEFLYWIKSNATTAILIGREYNSLISKVNEVIEEYMKCEISAKEFTTENGKIKDLEKSIIAKDEMIVAQKNMIDKQHVLITNQGNEIKKLTSDQNQHQQEVAILNGKIENMTGVVSKFQVDMDSMQNIFAKLEPLIKKLEFGPQSPRKNDDQQHKPKTGIKA